MNKLIKPKTYRILDNNNFIGYFHVSVNRKGDYVFDVKFIDVDKEPLFFKFCNSFNNYTPEVVYCWVEERIYPEDRENIEEILKYFNMLEYDPFLLLKHRNGISWDTISIDFSEEV